MINIFSKEITNFNNNGLGILRDSISCTAREELNGLFEASMEYPLFGANSEYLIEENIIMAPTPRGEQPFRIYSTETNLGTVYVEAKHIFYDLLNNFLEDVRPTNQNGAGSLAWILANTQFANNFSSNSNITKINSASYVRKKVVEALLGDDENSFLNRWGGELIRDKWNVTINQESGADRGVKITYGKNLLGLNASIDISNVITRIMPTGLMENDTVLSLPEKYVDSPYINYYSSPRIAHYHYSDIKISTEEGEELTEAEALELLREQASLLFSQQKVDEPILNINVDFIELSKTEEYKDYSILETIYPFDVVTVEYAEIGFSQKAKMISYEYDCLLEKYNRIELGQFISSYADSQAKVGQLLQKVSEEIVNNKSDLQKAIDNATELLTNALGGYVLKRPGELLIMDTEDPNTATKVWRWGINGLGYSSTGINGPYGLAMTMDGAIVASFITTGILNANLIKAGILQDTQGKNYINMENGTFSLGGGKITYDGDNLAIKLSDGTGLETKINAMAGQINSKVSSEDFASLIQQNPDSVKIAVGQIGGNNLIKNSGFEFGLQGWQITNSPELIPDQPWNRYNGNSLFIGGSGITSGIYQSFPTVIGKKYTVQFMGLIDSGYNHDTLIGVEGKDYRNFINTLTWTKFSFTFTATSTSHIFVAYSLGSAKFFIDNIQIEEGENATSWTPHYSELKGTNYTFDGQSFKIGSNANGNTAEHSPNYSKYLHSDGSYTQIDSAGLKRFISGEGKKYKYLVHVGTTTLPNTGGGYKVIGLPVEFVGIPPTEYEVYVSFRSVINISDNFVLKSIMTFVESKTDSYFTLNGTCQVVNANSPSAVTFINLDVTYIIVA